jgi:two-component system OmpR family response regulator
MSDEFDDALDPVLAARAREPAPSRSPERVPRLVAHLYAAADPTLRTRLLACLLRPLGSLGLAATAAGAFAGLQWSGTAAIPAAATDATGFSNAQIIELARFVEQVSPDALRQFASLIASNPVGVAAFAASATMLLLRALRMSTPVAPVPSRTSENEAACVADAGEPREWRLVSMRLLLVEDDTMIGESVLDLLRAEHYAVDWVSDGEMADTALKTRTYDLVLLDLGLPRRDGLSVLRSLRLRKDRIPVLIATARDSVQQRIEGLDAGADDYVLKPYDLDELLARIRALLRRAAGRAEPVYEHRGVSINPATREVTVSGQVVVLSAREWAVLEPLLARPGMVLSRAQLEEKLYGWKDEVSSNAVEVYIHGLRKKLGAELIQNVRGVGYMVPRD